jgi:hypothetical protein
VPEVVSFSFNATLGTAKGTQHGSSSCRPVESVSFPLFTAGERRSQAPLMGNGSLPRSMQETYVPAQVQLLCVAEVGLLPFRMPAVLPATRCLSAWRQGWVLIVVTAKTRGRGDAPACL